ncbi:hypothetical protein TYRP_002445 [Tyrophagus putrescentiae]|nr:hypothetical protein TYRP_002445 [Tyrophagus putrescentiae]
MLAAAGPRGARSAASDQDQVKVTAAAAAVERSGRHISERRGDCEEGIRVLPLVRADGEGGGGGGDGGHCRS